MELPKDPIATIMEPQVSQPQGLPSSQALYKVLRSYCQALFEKNVDEACSLHYEIAKDAGRSQCEDYLQDLLQDFIQVHIKTL